MSVLIIVFDSECWNVILETFLKFGIIAPPPSFSGFFRIGAKKNIFRKKLYLESHCTASFPEMQKIDFRRIFGRRRFWKIARICIGQPRSSQPEVDFQDFRDSGEPGAGPEEDFQGFGESFEGMWASRESQTLIFFIDYYWISYGFLWFPTI